MNVRKIFLMIACVFSGVSVFLPLYYVQLNGETVEVNDTETFDNGKRIIPTYLCDPIFVDCSNYEEILINSGYYELSEIETG